jgi:2,6-dihydroxypseudooxynicotine hydrolase
MDELVASAHAHWGPRFTANGVPVGDFDRVLGTVTAWSEWCREWSKAAARHEELGHEAIAQSRLASAGEHFSTAAVLYHFAKFVFVLDRGQMREAHLAAVRCHELALPLLEWPGRKISIPFEDAAIYGVLRLPGGTVPAPTVILIPGLDSTKEELRSTEDLFLQRGLATFSVDGPGQGEAEYDLPIRGDWEVPGRAIVDALEGIPEIDSDRIGVWGVSLGGYYAPRFASGDSRIAACVSLCGPYNFGENWDALPQLTRDTFVARSRSADSEAGRAVALTLSMEGRTDKLGCPMLIVSGRMDRLIPWQQQQRLHEETAAVSELLMLELGNHGCANVLSEHRYRTADWMARVLAAARPRANATP